MRPLILGFAAILCLGGCATNRTPAKVDVTITFNDYGFPSHSSGNPYSADEIGSANAFIEERINFYHASNLLEVHLVPTPHSNRLVFIATRPSEEPSNELRASIAKDVEGFLDTILATKPLNKKPDKSPEPMPLKRHGSS